MAKKRAPGGGRKPSGPITGKVSTFSTRITAETRAALDAEAEVRGLSVSQVAERLLELGIGVIRDRDRTIPSQGLLCAIGMLAAKCELTLPDGRRLAWNDDAFLFDALKIAINSFLDQIRPKEKRTAIGDETPASFAKWAFLDVWGDIQSVSPPSETHPLLTPNQMNEWTRAGYDMRRLRRDLNIKERKS
jgi:hypothetical protein